MTAPLKGIKVLEIGQAYAGPLAGAILGDMGAEVVKVEKPDGGDDARLWGPPFVDGDSLMFRTNNRNKKSITLDIKSAADIDRIKALAAESDILIQNLRPGIVEECGIGPDDLMALNPRLIYCSIWAFGYQGPLRMAPGFDPLLQAYSGLLLMNGREGDPPTFTAPAINDAATGMWCVIGALAGLQQRNATGKGCVIDTSLFETAASWVSGGLHSYLINGTVPKRHGVASAVLTPYQTFDTSDRPICIAAGNDRLFVKLAQAMGHPEWCEDARFADGRKRTENRAAMVATMQPVLKTRTRAEWMALLEKVGVPAAPVNDVGELAKSEQLAAMDVMRTLPRSGAKVVGLPISFDRHRPEPRRDSPKLGEHNDEVLGAIDARLTKGGQRTR